MEHVLVWESVHGPVPAGMELHHRNGDKLDNRIENLQLVSRLEHKRIHGGCEVRNGEWWKPCRRCQMMQPVATHYYRTPDGIMSICRTCAIRYAIECKRIRRERARKDSGRLAADGTRSTPAWPADADGGAK